MQLSLPLVASYESWAVRGTPKHQNRKYVFLITELDSIASMGELLSITVGHILPGEGMNRLDKAATKRIMQDWKIYVSSAWFLPRLLLLILAIRLARSCILELSTQDELS